MCVFTIWIFIQYLQRYIYFLLLSLTFSVFLSHSLFLCLCFCLSQTFNPSFVEDIFTSITDVCLRTLLTYMLITNSYIRSVEIQMSRSGRPKCKENSVNNRLEPIGATQKQKSRHTSLLLLLLSKKKDSYEIILRIISISCDYFVVFKSSRYKTQV